MDTDSRYGRDTLSPLRDQDVPPLDVSIERAIHSARRVTRRRTAAGAAAGVLAVSGVAVALTRPMTEPDPRPAPPAPVAPAEAKACTVARLPVPRGAQHTTATAVSPDGAYVGGAVLGSEETGELGSALLWHDGRLTTLRVDGRSPTPLGVNSSGIAVGGVTRNHRLVAWVFRGGKVEVLPALPGSEHMSATGVNDRGDIVGVAHGAKDVNTAGLWPAAEPGRIRSLAAPGSAGAMGISASGVVVGYAGEHAYVWDAAGAGRRLSVREGTALGIAGDWVYGTDGPATDDNYGSALKDAPHAGGRSVRWHLSPDRPEPLDGVEPFAITGSGAIVGPAGAAQRLAIVERDGRTRPLPLAPGKAESAQATATSADGRVIAGEQSSRTGTIPLRWHC
jgi:hypothetical protein